MCTKKELSGSKTLVIPSGEDGSLVDPVNFTIPYKVYRVFCPDTSDIAGGTVMTMNTSPDVGMTPQPLHESDDPGTVWSKTLSGEAGFDFALTHTFGDVLLQIVLDTVTTGDVTIYLFGYDEI